MNKYEAPSVEIIEVRDNDIITDSKPFENDSPLLPVDSNW